jgi:glycolate oxidase FAD binding subunit
MPETLTPRTSEEAAALVREAATAGRKVALSARNMTAVSEYEPADLVISVQAGATLGDIARAAAPHNQFLALDPAVFAETSIGSIVATNAAGPLRFAHGTPRDQVLGLEVVTGDGRLLEFGGKVVKNVAGYDIVRLLIGSRGALGFITRVNIRLKPSPAVDRTAILAADSHEAAVEIVDAVHDARLDPVALEIVAAPQWQVLARFHGNAEAVADGIARMSALGRTSIIEGADHWSALGAAEAAAAVNVRSSNLPSMLRDTIGRSIELAERMRFASPRYAVHAGSGIVRILATEAPHDGAEVMLREMRTAIIEQGGMLRVERMPGFDVEEDLDAVTLSLMQKLTNIFDPAGVFG